MRRPRTAAVARALVATCALAALSVLPVRGVRATEAPIGVIDLHIDLPYRHFFKKKPFSEGLGEFVADRLVPSGVVGVVLPLFVPEWASPSGPRESDLEDSYSETFGSILKTPPYSLPGCGIHRAGNEAREVETWLAFEGAGPLQAGDRAAADKTVTSWMLRGVRSFGLVHSQHNVLATSSGEPLEAGQGGLTPRGVELTNAIQRAGGIVDVSHASDATVDDVLRLAREAHTVVIATHSNARSLANHPRNLTDEHIAAIARTGGVIGVNFHQGFLSTSGKASLSDVVKQVHHMVRVAGVDHVALGSDYEGGIRPVPELRDASRYQVLAQALLDSGLDRAAVRKIFSENARRVLCAAPTGRSSGNP